MAVGHIVALHARRRSDAVALVGAGGEKLAWGELDSSVRSISAALEGVGVEDDDVVGLSLSNGLEAAILLLGVMAKAVAAPLNPSLTADEARQALLATGAKRVIVSRGDSPAATAAAALGLRSLDASLLVKRGTEQAPRERGRSERALLLPTTGTTSNPKLVSLTHGNLVAAAEITSSTLRLDAEDTCLNVMPLFHTHGLVGGLLSALYVGGTVVCTESVDDSTLLEAAERWRPTWTTAAPAIHHVLFNTARRQPSVFRFRFVRSASASLATDLMTELEQLYRAPVIEAYALTEAPGQVTSNPLPPLARKPGTVGVAAGCEVQVVEGADWNLGPNSVGEIVIRGPQVIDGYADHPSRGASDDFLGGWLRTGDLGRLDEEGYLTITGRVKEMINRGGEKIFPREVDATLLSHPAVCDAAAFPVFHRTLGEDLWAAVVLDNVFDVQPLELVGFLRGRLAPYKVPTRIVVVPAIPRTAIGKLRRHALAADLGIDA